MGQGPSRTAGWPAFAAAVLFIGGVAGIVSGLTAVYKSSFFSSAAVYRFSGLSTWGWIAFGLGVLAVLSGLAVVATRSRWARWTGAAVASLAFLGQMFSAQAYPLWSLVLMGVYGLAVYGLIARGDWSREAARAEAPREIRGEASPTSDIGSQRRAA